MLSWLSDFIKHLDVPTRIAWIALTFGLGCFVILRFNLLPAGELITETAAWLLSWFGASVLLVNAGYLVYEHFRAKIAATQARADEAARLVQRVEDLMLSLESLPPLEFGQLYWILLNGTRRVELPDGPAGLINKGLVNMVIRGRTSYVEVDGYIWMLRERFIKACGQIVHPAVYPTYNYGDIKPRVVTQLMKTFVQRDVLAALNERRGLPAQ